MTYLIEPKEILGPKPCPDKCGIFFCAIKPLYGIGPAIPR